MDDKDLELQTKTMDDIDDMLLNRRTTNFEDEKEYAQNMAKLESLLNNPENTVDYTKPQNIDIQPVVSEQTPIVDNKVTNPTYCQHCGTQYKNENQQFCLECGTLKGNGKSYCPNCGTKKKHADQDVCLGCGTQLTKTDTSFATSRQETPQAQSTQNIGNTMIHNTTINTIDTSNTNNYAYQVNKPVNKLMYIVLALFLGTFGIHKLYAGKPWILYLLFFWTGIPSIIAFIDIVVALFKPMDENGNMYF
jgi:TM2 domain-containing membrane protein YozV